MAEDWILPIAIASLILDIGTLWAIRLYRKSRRSPNPNPHDARASPSAE